MTKEQYNSFKNRKLIISIQGSDFIKYAGLLELAHSKGLVQIETDMVKLDSEKGLAIFKATARAIDSDGFTRSFDGYGDASPKNVGRMVAPHLIRVAETRAKARALRDLCGVGMCSVEELGER